MTGRGAKKRGRPPKVVVQERQKKFQYHLLKKPKYLLNQNKASDSTASTPSASRASSPQGSDGSRRSGARTRGQRKANRRGGLSGSAYQRRGYNPNVTDFLESEYHYGSDFGDESSEKSDLEEEQLGIHSDTDDSLGGDASSDSDFSINSYSNLSGTPRRTISLIRPPSPEPLWLQNRELPPLKLPSSSEDLLVSSDLIMPAVSIYEVLRHFRQLVRLSPFRLEDFCASLTCEEQSALLTEVHIMLIKALLREEEVQQTHFGPLDQKDSINITLYLIDNVTWPEVLRVYVESDKFFDAKVLNILESCEYPYTSVENRIKVLQFLTDQFLITNPVREDLMSEGPVHYDDHCRICFRLGDLLCCETCPAVFHLECVDPPLEDVPTEDWQCVICKSHKLSGVVDCISQIEKQGLLCRQEHLGFDRHGRKYWFLDRRIFVESEDGSEVWYYSTVPQLEELLSVLDKREFEVALCRELADFKEEIVRQMELTESLTNQLKGNKKSYFEIENANILKLQKDRQEISKIGDESLDDKSNSTEVEPGSSLCNDVDNCTMTQMSTVTTTTVTTTTVTETTRVTRQKLMQINNGTQYFKLGLENSYKSYVNQFTSNVIALNKPQRNEDRDKKRYLSHKFSLTPASEFKWIGTMNGTQTYLINTLRQTLLALENSIQSAFMHPNWSLLRKSWLTAVGACTKPSDFSKAMIILQACIKSVVFANVWHDQLGHVKLHRITAVEREEKKKLDKREKREKDDEEERNKLTYNFVKYTLGLKHQVWKQKGEEYRIHGIWGWLWLSSARKFKSVKSSRALCFGPHQIMLKIEDKEAAKILCLDTKSYEYLKSRNTSENDHNLPEELKNVKFLPISASRFEEIDVCKALTSPGRVLYPKIAHASKLDDFLARRIQLKVNEEKACTLKAKEIGADNDERTNKDKSDVSTGKTEILKSVAEKIQKLRVQYANLNRLAKPYKCYSPGCNAALTGQHTSVVSNCYSPLCIQKLNLRRELLQLLRSAHSSANNINSKKTSILEQKLSESKVIESKEKDPVNITNNILKAYSSAITYDTSLVSCCAVNSVTVKEECINKIDEHQNANTTSSLKLNESETKDLKEKVNIKADIDITDNSEKIPRLSLNNITTDDDIKNVNQSHDANNSFESTLDSHDMDTMTPEAINEMILGVKGDNFINKSNGKDDEASCKNDKSKYYTRARPAKQLITTTQITTTTTTVTQTVRIVDGVVQSIDGSSSQHIHDRLSHSSKEKNYLSCSAMSANSQYHAQLNRRFCTNKTTKREEVNPETEFAEDGSKRIYSAINTAGKIYLKNNNGMNGKKKKTQHIKYPVVASFRTRNKHKTIMVLPQHELKTLARHAGRLPVNGYHHLAKPNTAVWPYPCSRPLFKTCWLYRTVHLRSLAAVALQLRIVWTCLRWDDMAVKPSNNDGKHQVTTETEIMSLELLKHRHVGKFMEKTQYLRRRVVIPLELPKTIREVTSIRSGLRKRKRAESPQHTEPQVTEEWVDEDKLELWEIKQYGDKLDKANILPVTRTATGKLPPVRSAHDPSPTTGGKRLVESVSGKATPEEIKEKMEQQLRMQRAAHQQKRALELKSIQKAPSAVPVSNTENAVRIVKKGLANSK
ncbi:nucleosome-remodeling factor subunit NURF301-like, partial [Ctenocephalides felis]